jgi:hypothetical protein
VLTYIAGSSGRHATAVGLSTSLTKSRSKVSASNCSFGGGGSGADGGFVGAVVASIPSASLTGGVEGGLVALNDSAVADAPAMPTVVEGARMVLTGAGVDGGASMVVSTHPPHAATSTAVPQHMTVRMVVVIRFSLRQKFGRAARFVLAVELD